MPLPVPWMRHSLPSRCGCWEEHLVGERWESLPLAAASSAESPLSFSGVQGPGKKPENTVPDTFSVCVWGGVVRIFLDTCPRVGLTCFTSSPRAVLKCSAISFHGCVRFLQDQRSKRFRRPYILDSRFEQCTPTLHLWFPSAISVQIAGKCRGRLATV